MNSPSKTLWNRTSDHAALYESLVAKLGVSSGIALTPHGELLQSIGRIYYDRMNNGFGNGPFKQEFRVLSNNCYALLPYLSHEDWGDFRSEFQEMNLGEKVIQGQHWSGDELLEKVVSAVTQAVATKDVEYKDVYRRIDELVADFNGDSKENADRAMAFTIKTIRSNESSIDLVKMVALSSIQALDPHSLLKPPKVMKRNHP